MMAPIQKISPRTRFLLDRQEQINHSPTLSELFPKLKVLRVTVDYFDSTGVIRNGSMKYKINPAHGKSLFCFNCVHGDCAGGDFDLSQQLARAVAAKRKSVEGELRCQGTRHNKARKTDTLCQSILRYKLILGY